MKKIFWTCLAVVLLHTNAYASNQVMDGANVDMCLINPSSPDYVRNSKNEDLIDVSHRLGINLFRITDGGCAHGKGKAGSDIWNKILTKMARYGMSVIITAEPPRNGEELARQSVQYITSLVIDNKLGTYKNVFGIDVINEPTLDNNNIAMIAQTIHTIKSVYPHLPLSVGGWRTKPGMGICPANNGGFCWNKAEDGKLLEGLLDYYSAHIYGFDKPLNGPYPDPFTYTEKFLDKILPFANGKPVVIEEYGAANGIAVTDQKGVGSQQLQANVTDGVLRAVRAYHDKNVVGSTQWALYDRSVQTGTAGWQLILNKGDTFMPAAYVIQKYSLGRQDVAVNPPLPMQGKIYKVINTDNGHTLQLHPGDSVGIVWAQDAKEAQNYTMTIPPNVFSVSENFIYMRPAKSFVAMLHAATYGSGVITINHANCNGDCRAFAINYVIN